jgi:hypothetical protein
MAKAYGEPPTDVPRSLASLADLAAALERLQAVRNSAVSVLDPPTG